MRALATMDKRPLVFLGVGMLNTLLDFVFYTIITSLFFKNENSIAIAGFVSGTFALLCAFTTHSLITWRDKHVNGRTMLKFILFTGFGLWVIRPLLLYVFISFSGLYEFITRLLHEIGVMVSYSFVANTMAFGFMIVILLIYNYVVYSRFVYTGESIDRRTVRENH